MDQLQTDKPCLKLISHLSILTIHELKGGETIASADAMFDDISDTKRTFSEIGADELCEESAKTEVEVYKLLSFVSYAQIFGFFNRNLDDLCLTQSQIIAFIKKYPQWVSDGALFLFQSKGQLFVTNLIPPYFSDLPTITASSFSLIEKRVFANFSNVVVPKKV